MSFDQQPRRGRSHGLVRTPPSFSLHRRSTSRPRIPSKRVSFADQLAAQSGKASPGRGRGKRKAPLDQTQAQQNTAQKKKVIEQKKAAQKKAQQDAAVTAEAERAAAAERLKVADERLAVERAVIEEAVVEEAAAVRAVERRTTQNAPGYSSNDGIDEGDREEQYEAC